MDEADALPTYIQGLIKSNEQVNAQDEFLNYILNKHAFITLQDTGDIYIWDGNGIYQDYGESVMRKEFEGMFKKESKIHYFNEIKFRLEGKTQFDRENFNKDLNITPVENGLLDIHNYSLEPFNKDKHFSFKIPVKWDVNATCPKIDKFLSEIVCEKDLPTLYEISGWCLHRRYNIHKSIMLDGEGSNGKSTYLALLRRFLGSDNVVSLPIQLLEKNTFIRGKIYGKLANLCPELSGEALYNTGIFKAITGEDAITADKKHKEAFTFISYAKQIFATNVVPQVKNDDTYAFFRRWCIIEFPNKFEGKNKNDNLIDEIATPEELSGFLIKALNGLKRLFESGDFTTQMSVGECRKTYIRKSDSIKSFVEEMLEPSIEGNIPKDLLYNKYVEYCQEIKLVPKSKEILFKDLPRHIILEFERIRSGDKRIQVVKGIKYKYILDGGISGQGGLLGFDEKQDDISSGQGGQGKTPIMVLEGTVESYNKENTLTTMDKVSDIHNNILISLSYTDLTAYSILEELFRPQFGDFELAFRMLVDQGFIYTPRVGFVLLTEKGQLRKMSIHKHD